MYAVRGDPPPPCARARVLLALQLYSFSSVSSQYTGLRPQVVARRHHARERRQRQPAQHLGFAPFRGTALHPLRASGRSQVCRARPCLLFSVAPVCSFGSPILCLLQEFIVVTLPRVRFGGSRGACQRRVRVQVFVNPSLTPCSPPPVHFLLSRRALAWCPWQDNLLASGGGTADRHIRFWNTQTVCCSPLRFRLNSLPFCTYPFLS